MRGELVRVIFLAATTFCWAVAAEAATALRFNKMADGSGKVTADAVIVVEGDKIVSVGSGAGAVPAAAARRAAAGRCAWRRLAGRRRPQLSPHPQRRPPA